MSEYLSALLAYIDRPWKVAAVIVLVLAGGAGWMIGWLLGWALDGFAERKNAGKEVSPPEDFKPGKTTRKNRKGRWGPDHHR